MSWIFPYTHTNGYTQDCGRIRISAGGLEPMSRTLDEAPAQYVHVPAYEPSAASTYQDEVSQAASDRRSALVDANCLVLYVAELTRDGEDDGYSRQDLRPYVLEIQRNIVALEKQMAGRSLLGMIRKMLSGDDAE